MRLSNIKLAGFKSFVDPTTLAFPSNLTAIVGPNGCGKSNLIDAIRWVMGESSAKQLRGQSSDDVIFNGCATRKPLGQASIELNFDNTDGSLSGQYGTYTHIAIRREMARDGQSAYYLNGTRCRRRDIRDIFLGTGLGPKSYAIIEQGMISRVIEAKPDILRNYIEEVAGISRYKERRRETKNLLERTQANLHRLNDLSEELTKQAKHLQAQADAAERYKTYKQEERLLRAGLQALRYRSFNEQLQAQAITIKESETQLQTSQEALHTLVQETAQERERETQARADRDVSQTHRYTLGNQISRLEERLQHQTTQMEQNQREAEQLAQQRSSLEHQIRDLEGQKNGLHEELAAVQAEQQEAQDCIVTARTALEQAERQQRAWQTHWDQWQDDYSQQTRCYHIAQTQNQHLQQQSQRFQKNLLQLEQEQAEHHQILECEAHTAELSTALQDAQEKQQVLQIAQETLKQDIHRQRSLLQQLMTELDRDKSGFQQNHGQMASLLALQEETLDPYKKSLQAWLTQYNLAEYPRLMQLIQVETGWERAVEIALHRHIQAICLMDHNSLDEGFSPPPPDRTVSVMTKPMVDPDITANSTSSSALVPLSTKLTSQWPLNDLLSGIYAAETTTEAQRNRQQLKGHEFIITREGICFAQHWISWDGHENPKTGFLQREREITGLREQQVSLQVQIDKKQAHYIQLQQQLHQQEEQQSEIQTQFSTLVADQAELKTRVQINADRLHQIKQRLQRIEQEQLETKQNMDALKTALHQIEQDHATSQTQLSKMEERRQTLLAEKMTVHTALELALQQVKTDESHQHQLALRQQTAEYRLNTVQETISRLQGQKKELEKRAIELQQILTGSKDFLGDLTQKLETQHSQHQIAETQLTVKQEQLHRIEQCIKQRSLRIESLELQVNADRCALEQLRLQHQEVSTLANTLIEQLQEQIQDIEHLMDTLPLTADIASYETQLAELGSHIERIGAVNLAALEEHRAVLERKTDLDAQHQDLTEAINTLQTAIKKMDQETCSRFKEIFDRINQNLSNLFPRLFSGGTASLRLEDAHLADSGVRIMAQPPGKRNSGIEALSGGEKTLTAMALVFSFFQLNPAPFCMLDEIDSPLDDQNILKFCTLVREMSETVQFIFVSHNKLAIEMAQHLAGVTMREAGVSRIVAVDVEQAIAMASD